MGLLDAVAMGLGAIIGAGIYVVTGVAAGVALFGTLQSIVAAASFTILMYYALANLAALRMRSQDKLFPDWIPVLGALSCAGLALTLRPATIVSGLGLVAAGLLWRWLYRRLSGVAEGQAKED